MGSYPDKEINSLTKKFDSSFNIAFRNKIHALIHKLKYAVYDPRNIQNMIWWFLIELAKFVPAAAVKR